MEEIDAAIARFCRRSGGERSSGKGARIHVAVAADVESPGESWPFGRELLRDFNGEYFEERYISSGNEKLLFVEAVSSIRILR